MTRLLNPAAPYFFQGCSTLCSFSGDPAASESEMPHDRANRPVMAA
jgi:hypothetical protein